MRPRSDHGVLSIGLLDALWMWKPEMPVSSIEGEQLMTDDVKVLREAFDRDWGFREQTRSGAEKMHYEHWFQAGWRAAREAATVTPAVDREALARYFYMRNGGTEKNWDYLAERIRAGREPEHGRMICYQQADALLASGLLRDVRDVQAEALEDAADGFAPGATGASTGRIRNWLRARAQAIREARSER